MSRCVTGEEFFLAFSAHDSTPLDDDVEMRDFVRFIYAWKHEQNIKYLLLLIIWLIHASLFSNHFT